MTRLEQLNNAIVGMERVPHPYAATRTSIEQLALAWSLFWASAERRVLPDALLSGRAGRFLQWYARAYLLYPKPLRVKLVDPRAIDVGQGALSADTLASMAEANAQAVQTAGSKAEALAAQSARLASDIAQASGQAVQTVTRSALVLMLGAVAVLYMWGKRNA